MKKFLSIILAVVMIASFLPATFMTAAAAEGDIVFDFKAFQADSANNATQATQLVDVHPENLTLNPASPSPGSVYWQDTLGLRFSNIANTWESDQTVTKFNKAALDVTVSADRAGWYVPKLYYTTNYHASDYMSVYHIYNGTATYLGDVKDRTVPAASAVELKEGTNTFVFCGIGTIDVAFISKFELVKVASAPTISDVTTEGFPTEDLDIGEVVSGLKATVAMSDGTTLPFPAKAINTSTFVNAGNDTQNYLKIEADDTSIVKVTSAKGGMGERDITTYSLEALKGGTTNIVFTPVIAGVPQTEKAVTKTINVFDPNIAYDFSAFFTDNAAAQGKRIYEAEVSMPNFAANRTGSALETYQYWLNSSIRIGNVNGDWYATKRNDTTGNNKVVWDINVPEGKAGWYTPSFTFYANNADDTFTIYNIADGKTAYVGDFKRGGASTNAVCLYEGRNTLVLAFTGGVNTTYFAYKLLFTKLDAEPTVASVIADAPASLKLGDTSETYTATVAMDDGTNYLFPSHGVDASFYSSTTEATSNYLKITAYPADVVSITATNGGAGNHDKTNYTFTALKEGTTTVTFTPVINGIEKTDVEVKKTINVVDENIVYDFAEWCKSIGLTANDRHIVFTDENTPAGFSIAEGMTELLKWDAGYLRFESIADSWGSDEAIEKRAPGSRYAMIIDVPEGKAGWYTPQFTYHGNAGETGLCSVYHIYNGEATYLGDTVNSGDNYLAPVYLEAGENTIAVAIIADTEGMFVEKLAFYKYEGEQATLTGITVAEPADLTVGETSVAYEITGEMSDGSAMKFPPFGMDTETFHNSGLNTTDYIKVTATPANVVEVNAYSGGYAGMDKYYYEVKAVSEGDVVLTFVPYVDGVEKTDLKQTKTVSVTYPNASVNYTPNFIVDAVVGEEGISTEARELITSKDLAIGEVDNAALGSWVTLEAKDSETLKFLYWYNGNSKVILSDEEKYSFQVGTKAAIYAKYARVGDKLVEHATAAGQIVDSLDGETKTKEIGSYYTLIYKEAAAAASTLVNETATLADFVCWVKDGQIVSYNENYSFYTWGNALDADEVTEGEKSDVPAVVLFKDGNAYMLELVNFEGKTIVEKGILFANGGTPTVDSFGAKAVATTDKAQFTASTDASVARAYVIYLDGGKYRVAYSD